MNKYIKLSNLFLALIYSHSTFSMNFLPSLTPTLKTIQDCSPVYLTTLSKGFLVPGVGFVTTCWIASKCYDRYPYLHSLGNRNAIASIFLQMLWSPSTNIFFQSLSHESQAKLNQIRIGRVAHDHYQKNSAKISKTLTKYGKVENSSPRIEFAAGNQKLLLLHGPSGTGKTYITMCIASKYNYPIWILKQNEIKSLAPSPDEITLAYQTALNIFGETLEANRKSSNLTRIVGAFVLDEFDKTVRTSNGVIDRSAISFLCSKFENSPYKYNKNVYIWPVLITNKPDLVYSGDISDRAAIKEFIGFPDSEKRESMLKNYVTFVSQREAESGNHLLNYFAPNDSNDSIEINSNNNSDLKIQKIKPDIVEKTEASSFRGLKNLVVRVADSVKSNNNDFDNINNNFNDQIKLNQMVSTQNLNEYNNDSPVHAKLLRSFNDKNYMSSISMLSNAIMKAQDIQNQRNLISIPGQHSLRRSASFQNLRNLKNDN